MLFIFKRRSPAHAQKWIKSLAHELGLYIFPNSSFSFKILPNFWSTLNGEKDNMEISKLNLFELVTPRKSCSIFNVETYKVKIFRSLLQIREDSHISANIIDKNMKNIYKLIHVFWIYRLWHFCQHCPTHHIRPHHTL